MDIYNGNWELEYVLNKADSIFVFNDNIAGLGKASDAVIRDCGNSFGVLVRKGPGTKNTAFFTDKEYGQNVMIIDKQMLKLKKLYIEGKNIVFNSAGYGNGQNKLSVYAPLTYEYLCSQLRGHFNFDNTKGTKYNKTASHSDIEGGVYVSLQKKDSIRNNIITPINNSYFRKEYLNYGYNTFFQLIKEGKKVAFTQNVKYSNGDIIIFTFGQNYPYLVCRVTNSYSISMVRDYWCFFEGLDDSFIEGVTVFDGKVEYYQTHFQYLSTLDTSGNMVFRDGIVNDVPLITEEQEPKSELDPIILDFIKKNNIEGSVRLLDSDRKSWMVVGDYTHIITMGRSFLGKDYCKLLIKFKS